MTSSRQLSASAAPWQPETGFPAHPSSPCGSSKTNTQTAGSLPPPADEFPSAPAADSRSSSIASMPIVPAGRKKVTPAAAASCASLDRESTIGDEDDEVVFQRVQVPDSVAMNEDELIQYMIRVGGGGFYALDEQSMGILPPVSYDSSKDFKTVMKRTTGLVHSSSHDQLDGRMTPQTDTATAFEDWDLNDPEEIDAMLEAMAMGDDMSSDDLDGLDANERQWVEEQLSAQAEAFPAADDMFF